MRHRYTWPERVIALALSLTILVPSCAVAAPMSKRAPQQSSSSSASADSQHDASAGNAASVVEAKDAGSNTQTAPASQNTSTSNQSAPPPATGTALAPYEKAGGITGSKPAGAAIAAGKQHRSRTFAVRVGLLVGAAIAIGAVAGASLGSPARAN